MLAVDFRSSTGDPRIIYAHSVLPEYYNSYTWVIIMDFIVLKKDIFVNYIRSIVVLILCILKV